MNASRQIHGILLLDKPKDITSNAALQITKRLFQAKKAGHTGSLDPLATGMLPICFGEATKFSQFLLDSDKVYQVVAKLGIKTTTGDSQGEIIKQDPTVQTTAHEIERAMTTFLGESEQVPPMYSAIKLHGKPLYKLARKGIEVERKPRKINIFFLQLEKFEQDEFTFQVHCSKGTYVRTLVEDIGALLGYGCHVTQLRRVRVSPYHDSGMVTLESLENIISTKGVDALIDCLLPVETSVQAFPAIKLSSTAVFYLRQGQTVRAVYPEEHALVRLFAENNEFLGVGEVASGRLKPHRLIAV